MAESEYLSVKHDVAIRNALDYLPVVCRYHGTDIEDRVHVQTNRYGGACCETGMPALARRRAIAALTEISP